MGCLPVQRLRIPTLLAGTFATLLPIAGCFDLFGRTLPPQTGPEQTPAPTPEPPRFAWPFEITATFNAPDVAYAPLTHAVERATSSSMPLDVNSDGWPDVVLVDAIQPHIHTFLGDGSGALRPAVVTDLTLEVGASGIDSAPVAGDFDGDGDVDLAFTRYWWVGVLPNNGDGSFGAPTLVEMAELSGSTGLEGVTADFNDDGDLDLALASTKPAGVWILQNDGLANFSLRAERYSGTHENDQFLAIATADVDGDERADLAVTVLRGSWDPSGDEVRILSNKGDGSFAFSGALSVGWGPTSIVAASLGATDDTRLSLAVANTSLFAPSVALLRANDGADLPAEQIVTPTGGSGSIVAGDVDADGDADLLVSQTQTHRAADVRGMVNGLNLLFNHDGRFERRDLLSLPLRGDGTNGSIATAALVDLNLDGAADAVVFDSGYGVAELVVMMATR